MPASTNGGGATFAIPDVCNVPSPAGPVPTPFPNMAGLSTADGTVSRVIMDGRDTVVESSTLPNSQGDEVGTQFGVTSGTQMDKVSFKTYSFKVMADGKKVVFMTAQTAHNGSNANAPCGMQVAPSQAKVLVGM